MPGSGFRTGYTRSGFIPLQVVKKFKGGLGLMRLKVKGL
jgi:hypothetical protein